jgi:hypothetical protein
MELAYDFNCYSEIEDYGHNYYLYSNSSHSRARIYNKKEELFDKQGIQIEDEQLMRFEIRIKPPISKQSPLRGNDFQFVNHFLEKFNGRFSPHLHDLKGELTSRDLYLLYKIMRRRDKKRLLSESKQFKKIRHIIENNAFNFSTPFVEKKDALFNWIPPEKRQIDT